MSVTKEDCINEILRVWMELPEEAALTRNYFRKHSVITQQEYENHFGSFKRLKEAAGIDPTRGQQKILNQTGKHASHDHLMEFQQQKMSWEGKYLRPSDKRHQLIQVGSDMHDVDCDPYYRRLFVDGTLRAQPDKIILNGDLFDLYEFSKYTHDPREVKIIDRIMWVHRFLGDLRAAAPNAEIHLIEGNHEVRLVTYLMEKAPQMVQILDQIHGLDVIDILGIRKFEVNYHARASLKCFTASDIKKEIEANYYIAYDSVLFHHFPHGVKMGYPGVNGHHHKFTATSHYSPIFGPYQWIQIGCGCKRRAGYTGGEIWSNGFAFIHVNTATKKSQFEYIDCSHDDTVIGGKYYMRTEDEKYVVTDGRNDRVAKCD